MQIEQMTDAELYALMVLMAEYDRRPPPRFDMSLDALHEEIEPEDHFLL